MRLIVTIVLLAVAVLAAVFVLVDNATRSRPPGVAASPGSPSGAASSGAGPSKGAGPSGGTGPSAGAPSGGSGGAGSSSAPPSATTRPPQPPGATEKARVVWVSDGDTMIIQPIEGEFAGREQRIRLIGLDAPEMKPTPECWAKESTAALLKLTPRGSFVTIGFDDRKFDDYKRQLRYVWNAQGVLVNREQLAQGNAFYLRVWPNVRYEKDFRATAEQARKERRGLWGACENPLPPVHTGRPASMANVD